MPWTSYVLDNFIAQELSTLSQCTAPDLSKEFDEGNHWVGNFILHSIFPRYELKAEAKPYAFGMLRRAQMALIEYESGRKALLEYLAGDRDRVSQYFRALYHFEITVMIVYQVHELLMGFTDEQLFAKGDGSPLYRLNRIYNVSKHLEASTVMPGQLHAVWITNSGLAISTTALTWEELAQIIRDVGGLADQISSSPRTGNAA
jgi:hypothetical protein